MCEKCKKDSSIRNTRYCNDWWDDTSHGGYNADRDTKSTKNKESSYGYTYGRPIDE